MRAREPLRQGFTVGARLAILALCLMGCIVPSLAWPLLIDNTGNVTMVSKSDINILPESGGMVRLGRPLEWSFQDNDSLVRMRKPDANGNGNGLDMRFAAGASSGTGKPGALSLYSRTTNDDYVASAEVRLEEYTTMHRKGVVTITGHIVLDRCTKTASTDSACNATSRVITSELVSGASKQGVDLVLQAGKGTGASIAPVPPVSPCSAASLCRNLCAQMPINYLSTLFLHSCARQMSSQVRTPPHALLHAVLTGAALSRPCHPAGYSNPGKLTLQAPVRSSLAASNAGAEHVDHTFLELWEERAGSTNTRVGQLDAEFRLGNSTNTRFRVDAEGRVTANDLTLLSTAKADGTYAVGSLKTAGGIHALQDSHFNMSLHAKGFAMTGFVQRLDVQTQTVDYLATPFTHVLGTVFSSVSVKTFDVANAPAGAFFFLLPSFGSDTQFSCSGGTPVNLRAGKLTARSIPAWCACIPPFCAACLHTAVLA